MLTRLLKPLQMVVALTTSAGLSACMTWQELAPQPTSRFSIDSTQTYRLTLASGDTLVVSDPQVVGDTLRWTEQVSGGTIWIPRPRELPLADVRGVEIQRASPVGAIGAVAMLVLGLGLVAGLSGPHIPPSLW